MSAEFRPTSHQESANDITPTPDGQEILEQNKPSEYKSIDRTTAGNDASTDHSNPVSVEYNYIDDVNPASGYQAIEGSQSEANDYECIAGTNPAYDYIEVITGPRTPLSKCKKAILFLVPIFASVTMNIMAGYYTSFFFLHRIVFGRDSSEVREMVAKVSTTFRLFSALAAASCAQLMSRYGFRKVALVGSALLICSYIYSSLATTVDIQMAILSSIMGGFAVGLLRAICVVATVDYLYTRPSLALVISYTSFTFGNLICITVIIIDLIQYDDSSRAWSDAMWVFEITAVMGLVAGCFLQKNSQTQQNVLKLLKHPPFYFLMSIRVIASVGFSILLPEMIIFINHTLFHSGHIFMIYMCVLFVSQFIVLIVLGIILQKKNLLTMGISITVAGLVTLSPTHQVAQLIIAFSILLGGVFAYSQVMMSLALVKTTGRSNWKLALPVLSCLEDMGGLIGSSLMATTSASGALYFGGVSLIIAGGGAIIAWVMIKRWSPLSDEEEAKDRVDDHVEDHVEDRS